MDLEFDDLEVDDKVMCMHGAQHYEAKVRFRNSLVFRYWKLTKPARD